MTVGGSMCCAEGLGLAVGKALRTQDTPSLPSWSHRCMAALGDGTLLERSGGTWEKGRRPAASLACRWELRLGFSQLAGPVTVAKAIDWGQKPSWRGSEVGGRWRATFPRTEAVTTPLGVHGGAQSARPVSTFSPKILPLLPWTFVQRSFPSLVSRSP